MQYFPIYQSLFASSLLLSKCEDCEPTLLSKIVFIVALIALIFLLLLLLWCLWQVFEDIFWSIIDRFK